MQPVARLRTLRWLTQLPEGQRDASPADAVLLVQERTITMPG